MRKRLIVAALTTVLLAMILCCTGCLRWNAPPEEKFQFKKLSQQERKDYIYDFLQKEYGLSCEIDGEVMKKYLGPFRFDENYFAIAKTSDNHLICVWISDGGKITDTVFMLDMKSELADFFTEILSKKIPKFKLDTHTDVLEIPSEKLTRPEDIHDFLMEQDTHSVLNIFVDDPAIANEELLDELEQELNFCHVSIWLYVCEDLEQFDISSYDPYAYQYYRGVDKKE